MRETIENWRGEAMRKQPSLNQQQESAVDKFIRENGVTEAVNTGKVYSFMGRTPRRKKPQ